MQIGRLVRPLAHSLLAALMLSAAASLGDGAMSRRSSGMGHRSRTSRLREENELVQAVREATARFKNVTNVAGPGRSYALMFGCVSGGDFGAMGLHYLNGLDSA